MASTPEAKVKRKFDMMVKAEGVYCDKPQAGIYGRAGIPDRILCVCGLYIGVEIKADASKEPTRLQLLCRDRIEAAGGKWFLVYDDATVAIVRDFIRDCRRRQTSTGPKAQGHKPRASGDPNSEDAA